MKKVIDILQGRKSTFTFLGIIVSFLIALIWSYIIKDWGYLKFFTPWAIGGLTGYGVINVAQKKLVSNG